ncbi:MAG: hypothetical protein DRP52_05295 [Planctomycetota bacterium]|nr:MAG: hypothetical protein DRP52_05295 [Planctomycetota bacterium]RLA87740.1 MAG: hypothetical protein DRG58_09970 [Deltaproteobacteria bacterium]HHE74609.1 hypothetical protein [Desulfobacteraceae bacterium]
MNDGPCRSYPEQYQYDKLDVAPYLKTGANEIKVVAGYFGAGTLFVEWQLSEKTFDVKYSSPRKLRIEFIKNVTHGKYYLVVNGVNAKREDG